MMAILLAAAVLGLALLPAALTLANLRLFGRPASGSPRNETSEGGGPLCSVCIPARNEEAAIEAAVRSILAAVDLPIEVIVVDDHSEDATGLILERISGEDSRLQRVLAPSLPAGWNGKQHACSVAATHARGEWLLFLDADVRLQPSAIAALIAEAEQRQVGLLSGFPRQVTLTWAESSLVPMMYVILLGYLPLSRSRAEPTNPALAAGCGQLFLARRADYQRSGGHAAIAGSRHDGIMLPRLFRRCGISTDICDASELASCRMYADRRSVLVGLLKNAREGIANRRLIVPFTVLLIGGFVAPLLLLPHAIYWRWPLLSIVLLAAALLLSFVPRLLIARRLERQRWTVIASPLIVAWFVLIQWWALVRDTLGIQTAWRGRSS